MGKVHESVTWMEPDIPECTRERVHERDLVPEKEFGEKDGEGRTSEVKSECSEDWEFVWYEQE